MWGTWMSPLRCKARIIEEERSITSQGIEKEAMWIATSWYHTKLIYIISMTTMRNCSQRVPMACPPPRIPLQIPNPTDLPCAWLSIWTQIITLPILLYAQLIRWKVSINLQEVEKTQTWILRACNHHSSSHTRLPSRPSDSMLSYSLQWPHSLRKAQLQSSLVRFRPQFSLKGMILSRKTMI